MVSLTPVHSKDVVGEPVGTVMVQGCVCGPGVGEPTGHKHKHAWRGGEGMDCPDGPVVKALPSNARGQGLIPGRGTKIHMPPGRKPKHKNRNNIVTNSIC